MKKTTYSLLSICFLLMISKTFAGYNTSVIEYNVIHSHRNSIAIAQSFVSKPSQGSVNIDVVLLKVTANLVTGAKRYTIELSTVPDFSDSSLIRTSTADNQRTLVFNKLKYSTKYYARVKTDLSPLYGKTINFTTRAEQFSFVSSPTNSSDNIDFKVLKVEVALVYQASRYTVQLSSNAAFSGTLISSTSYTNTQRTFVFKDLTEQTTYYARVITDVSTDFGNITSFTTRKANSARRFWGLTTSGGIAGSGTVFSFSLDSLTFTKHHDNVSTEYLHGNLIQGTNRNLFGMGIQYSTGDAGEIFKISATGNYTPVYNNGGIHFGSLMLASDNYLYAVDDWINAFRGGMRKLNPDGSDQDVLASVFHKFRSDKDGKNPIAAPIEVNGYLYGMAPYGGVAKKGVIYRKKLDGALFEVLHSFNGTAGSNPQGSLVLGSDGYLYGLTFGGGSVNAGTIFKIMPDGSDFTKLYDFDNINGQYPFGDLIQYENYFYGMTSEGGTNGNGVIFKINSNGTLFTKIFDFNGTNGAIPLGSLTADDAGILYGMASAGGINNLGVIFKVNSNGSSFAKLYDFSEGGGNPDGNLLLIEDTFGDGSSSSRNIVVESNDKILFESNYVNVYPNPFASSITVEVNLDKAEKTSVTIMDLSGRIVHQSQTNLITQFGNDLVKGSYMMKVVKGNRVSIHHIVKH